MTPDVRYPIAVHERVCANCSSLATSVINDIPQCNLHAGHRMIEEFPEILGDLLAQKLRTG